jgi:hypothetical protein
MVFDGEFLVQLLLDTGIFSREMAFFLSSIILEIPDKVITVIICLIIVNMIPEEIYPNFSLHS